MRVASRHPVWRALAIGTGVVLGAYSASVALAWSRYGRAAPAAGPGRDPLLDRFMPVYEVAERHHIEVDAPAAVTLSTAIDLELFDQPVPRALFRARELILRPLGAPGASAAARTGPARRGLLSAAQSIGWRVLEEDPGREVVVGAVTKPWEPQVTFRGLAPEEFSTFAEPGYVKIAWTLRADPVGEHASIFRTETRVMTTDAAARAKFRRYWSVFSPGIILIRWVALRPVKLEAERRQRQARRR